jgi:hypothetical protein
MPGAAVMLGLVFLFESACVSRAVAPKPMRPSCANYVDDQLHPRERPGAVLRWRIAEGAPGREYEMLVELDRTGRLSFVDIRWSAPGPEGLASRTRAPGVCFTRTLAQQEVDSLEATLVANRFCAQKVVQPDPDVAPNHFDVHLGRLDCAVDLDQREDAMTSEGRAAYRALLPLQRER